MDISPPMRGLTFNDTITTTMHPSYVEVTCKDMQNSATDIRKQIVGEYTEDEVCHIAVSCDGTWHRRGYASLNDVVSAVSIESGKVSFLRVLS